MRKPKIAKLYGRNPFGKSTYSKDWGKRSAEIKKRDNNMCVDCGSTKNLHAHHIVSKAHSSSDGDFNTITLCENCHSKRHKHMIIRRR